MSVLYTVLLLKEDVELQKWLQEQGIIISENIRPSHWPTLDEMSKTLDRLDECKTWNYGGGTIQVSSDKDSQFMYVLPPYPVKPDDKAEFYLTGYCKEIIEPLLDQLSTICGSMVVVRHGDAKVVYTTK